MCFFLWKWWGFSPLVIWIRGYPCGLGNCWNGKEGWEVWAVERVSLNHLKSTLLEISCFLGGVNERKGNWKKYTPGKPTAGSPENHLFEKKNQWLYNDYMLNHWWLLRGAVSLPCPQLGRSLTPPFEKEHHLPTIFFLGSKLVFGGRVQGKCGMARCKWTITYESQTTWQKLAINRLFSFCN